MGKRATVAKGQQAALARLRRIPALRRFYLAGGTALTCHLGHRRSLDLDLFSEGPRVDLEEVERAVVEACPDVVVIDRSDAALKLRLGRTPVDLVRYPYPLLTPPVPGEGGIPTAGLLDLAVMKLAAIASRGIRRDFWDLREILAAQQFSLAEVGSAYCKRFGTTKADLYHVARSLTWFADAERDTLLPAGLSPARWREIKRFFEAVSPTLVVR